MKRINLKLSVITFLILLISISGAKAQTTEIFHEGFDTLSTMFANGWTVINKSNPLGTTSWFQGNTTVGRPALSGDSTSYAQVQFTSTSDVGTTNTISDWLLTPQISLSNFDTVSFYTISYNSATYPDNLECRFSTMGISNNVGTDEFSVGDFSGFLFAINPSFNTTSFPSVTGSGANWSKFIGVVTGLTGTTNCRLAIRYYVINGGLAGANSSSVGVDEFSVMHNPNAAIDEHSLNVAVLFYPNPAKENITINFSERGNYLITIFNVMGQNVLSNKTENNIKMDISDLPSSLYTARIVDTKTGKYKTISFIKE